MKITELSVTAIVECVLSKPYRSGPKLIEFFNEFGWQDTYHSGFPSRYIYAYEKTIEMNEQNRIEEVILKAVDPRNFLDTEFDSDDIVTELNNYFQYDGFNLIKHDLYYEIEYSQKFGNLEDNIKNIIFASSGPKPDILIKNALTNDIEIVKNKEYCLIYDRPILEKGLSWNELVEWWASEQNCAIDIELERILYQRLFEAIPNNSPPAQTFFKYYYSFKNEMSNDFPVLLPEVYLHFDPKTISQRKGNKVLKQQRMDFLLLLPQRNKIVIEIDGKHHYSHNDIANPYLYADMVSHDRDLKLAGYEVYRFGAVELTGSNAKNIVKDFISPLFLKYGLI